jgi:hypothetical protein
MKSLFKGVVVVAVLAVSMSAFAKGKGGAKKTCMKDGTEVTDAKDKKACKAAGGKWEKAPAPAPTDAPAPPSP